MRWVLYAKGERGLAVLHACLAADLRPSTVVLQASQAELEFLAEQKAIPIHLCATPKSEEHRTWLTGHAPDLLLCAGYSRMLPKRLLSIPRLGGLNCHGGKVPEYRGASVIPWQLLNGETIGGAFLLKMTPGIDDGPVVSSRTLPIASDDTATTLTQRVNQAFAELVPVAIKQIQAEQTVVGIPQVWSPNRTRLWTPRIPEDGQVDWLHSRAEQVVNKVRALTGPYPGAWTLVNGERWVLHKARIHPERILGVPGRYVGLKQGVPTFIARDRAVAILDYSVEEEL